MKNIYEVPNSSTSKVRNLGTLLGQCNRCGELGPASLTCHLCFKRTIDEIRGKPVFDPQRMREDSCNRWIPPFFNRELGLYGYVSDLLDTNFLYDGEALKYIPENCYEMSNFSNWIYDQDQEERYYADLYPAELGKLDEEP